MSDPNDLFDAFREADQNLEQQPSEQVWQRVQLQLEKRRKEQRRRPTYLSVNWWVLAIIMVLLLLCAVIVVWLRLKGL